MMEVLYFRLLIAASSVIPWMWSEATSLFVQVLSTIQCKLSFVSSSEQVRDPKIAENAQKILSPLKKSSKRSKNTGNAQKNPNPEMKRSKSPSNAQKILKTLKKSFKR